MELLDVVDENNNLTGRQEDREVVHRDSLWHREVVIWIMNENGEVLLQKRSATKKSNPNKWGVTAGHVESGEEPLEVAKRETLKEIGLELKDDDLEFLFLEKSERKNNNHFKYMYYVKTNKKISEFVIQKEELNELKYITIDEFKDVIERQDEEYVFSKGNYIPKLISILKNKEENL